MLHMSTTLNKDGSLLTEGLPVDIYWNLHKHLYSVRARAGAHKGRVIAHMTEVALTNVKFHVDQKGRERVINEKRKNVHAYLRGQWTFQDTNIDGYTVTYNPYKYTSFVVSTTKNPISNAPRVKGMIMCGNATIMI
jgi:hypothetical protein